MKGAGALFLSASLLCLACGLSSADEAVVTSDQSAVLADVNDGITRVGFLFSLEEVPSGEGRVIDEAYLELNLSGIPSEVTSSFELFEATTDWTVQGGELSAVTSEAMTADWLITPRDYEVNAGFVKLDVTELVRGWSGGRPNKGVVLSTSALTHEAIDGQLSGALLRIRYAFVKE